MNQFSIWPNFGFSENPYRHENLPPSDVGDRLLVGRDAEVLELQMRLGSAGTHPTVEGPAGVGKSSLLAVASYRMSRDSIAAQNGTVFLPVQRFFQANDSLEAFETEVYREIAQTLIANVEAFRIAGLQIPNIGALDKWLNTPQYRNAQGSAFSFGGGYGSEPNTSEGFTDSGFPAAVRAELARLFPGPGAGAIICVLDNLEILQTSGHAREVLEQLRDRLFNLQGLRWVLCGSRGIVSRARSQRLSGFFSAPMRIAPLSHDSSIELVRRRIEEFGSGDGAYPPVPPAAFEFIYRALNQNLRDALGYAHQFSEWLYMEYVLPQRDLPEPDDLGELVEVWLTEIADAAHNDARSIQRRVWQFFDQLASSGGTCRASEYEMYVFSTQQQFGSSVTALENANLVVREVDPDDATRRLAVVTPVGWLVYFNRNKYRLPSAQHGLLAGDTP